MIRIWVKCIEAEVIYRADDYHHSDGHAQCKSENVNERKEFMLEQISPRDNEIVSDHMNKYNAAVVKDHSRKKV